ncbi:glycosyltransferase family 39 protein [Candidatus Daviesbacteria bacterium]|nr:glycosyltransferase family 39 protein [Candidatus Daviesbacteria bacterium]
MLSRKRLIVLGFILLLALVVRIYKIDQAPASLYYDEVDYGYQARSLIETHKDYRGELSPFYVHSFNDIRAPIPAYLTLFTTLLFKDPYFQVRMPLVISGVIVVLFVFLLVNLWTKNFWMSVIVALVFSINPWQIQFSRFSHEAVVMMLFYLAGLFSFYKSLQTKKFSYLFLSTILFSLTVYTYRTMSLFTPVTALVLFLIYREEIWQFGLTKLVLAVITGAVIVIPFLYATTIGAPDVPRINQLSITSDQAVPVWVQRNREVDSGDYENQTLGKKAVWYSYFFHNKPLSWLGALAKNYYDSFSTQFLFTKGDPNPRHSAGKLGELFYIDIIGFIFGLIFLYRNFKQKVFKWLTFWLLFSPLPAAITIDGSMHAARLFIFSAPLLITVGLGWWFLFSSLRKTGFGRVVMLPLITVWLLLFIFYLHRYFVHFPLESAKYHGYGFKQMTEMVSKLEKNYKSIYLVSTNDPPMIYYLFWSDISPKYLQEYGTNFSQELVLNKKLDKVKVINWDKVIKDKNNVAESLDPRILYVVTTTEVNSSSNGDMPEGVKEIGVVKYPSGEIAFRLITKDPNYKLK